MTNQEHKDTHPRDLLVPAGILLLVSGAMILLDQRLQTGWLSQVVIILAGILILAGGVLIHNLLSILAGGLLTSISIGGFLLLNALDQVWNFRLGIFLLLTGVGWILVYAICVFNLRQHPLWMLIPAGLLGSLGACFILGHLRFFDIVLFLGIGLSAPLLIWGVYKRLLGLIIPGSLILGSVTGVYLGWAGTQDGSVLAHTGIMLVFFGLGWLLITVISRVIISKSVWWPLIPGSIIAMVGWGLYIGGNPSNALSFVSNTGSIALIMLGIYLILLQKGIH